MNNSVFASIRKLLICAMAILALPVIQVSLAHAHPCDYQYWIQDPIDPNIGQCDPNTFLLDCSCPVRGSGGTCTPATDPVHGCLQPTCDYSACGFQGDLTTQPSAGSYATAQDITLTIADPMPISNGSYKVVFVSGLGGPNCSAGDTIIGPFAAFKGDTTVALTSAFGACNYGVYRVEAEATDPGGASGTQTFTYTLGTPPPPTNINLTFHVTDLNNTALQGAQVTLNGQNQNTNSSGNTTFSVLPNATYTYDVDQGGYNRVIGRQVAVGTSDQTENVQLTPNSCVPNGCAANTCIGSTCDDGCRPDAPGTKVCTGSTFDAQMIDLQVASQMVAGSNNNPVSITFKNTGNAAWTGNQGVGVYSQPSNTWVVERSWNGGAAIQPGQNFTVAGDIPAPATAGVYDFQLRMVDANGTLTTLTDDVWFGETAPLAAPLQIQVVTAPVVQDPSPQTVTAPAAATFTASATQFPTYQWERANPGSSTFAPISGATTASYTLSATNVAADNGARFRVVANNVAGRVTSNPATLTVNSAPPPPPNPPTITTQPSNQSVQVGQRATFSVVAANATSYEWSYRDSSTSNANVIPGATAASYTTPPTVITNNGRRYFCKAINSVGSATSNMATLTVTAAPLAPSTDISLTHAYPIPYKPSKHSNGITFNNLQNDTSIVIKIFTINGRLVKELKNTSGNTAIVWDPVKNEEGEYVVSGVYIYSIKNDEGEKRGKLVIVR